MATISETLADAILDLITGEDVEISLHNDDPGKDGANELDVSAVGYARVVVEPTDWSESIDEEDGNGDPTGRRLRRVEVKVDYGLAGSNWGTVSHFGIWRASDGRFLIGAALTTPQTVSAGNPVYFDEGMLSVPVGGL